MTSFFQNKLSCRERLCTCTFLCSSSGKRELNFGLALDPTCGNCNSWQQWRNDLKLIVYSIEFHMTIARKCSIYNLWNDQLSNDHLIKLSFCHIIKSSNYSKLIGRWGRTTLWILTATPQLSDCCSEPNLICWQTFEKLIQQDHLRMNVAPDQTIILGLEIILDHRSKNLNDYVLYFSLLGMLKYILPNQT